MTLITFFSSILDLGAGFCIFVWLYNRRLSVIPDARWKRPFIILVFFLLAGGFAALGHALPGRPGILVPATIFGLFAIGEVRRALIRNAATGSRPIDTIPHQVDWRRPFTTTDLVCHHYEIALPEWRGTTLRIVHLSDFHANPSLPLTYYQEVFRAAEEAQADIAFLTGDFVTSSQCLPLLRQFLRPVAKQGNFAVLGNHDYWAGAEGIREAIRGAGIELLTNDTVEREINGGRLSITGWDHPWGTGQPCITLGQTGSPHFVLSHTPDNIYRLAEAGAQCVFSGHHHAGQIRIPILGPLVVPSIHGRRFDHGHFVVNGTHLFVASGVGSANPAIRIYCHPDIFIVDLKRLP